MGRLSGSRFLMRVICGLLVISCSAIIAPPSVLARMEPPASYWIDFRESRGEPGFPIVENLESSPRSIILKGTFPGAWAAITATEEGEFTSFDLDPYGRPTETGLPALPVLRELIKIPYKAGTRLEVISAEYKDILLSELELPPPLPLQPSQPKTKIFDGSDGFEIDREFYASGTLYPAEPVQTGEAFVMRGNDMHFIVFNPVAYDPSAKMLRLYSEITVKVEFEEGGQGRFAEFADEAIALEETKDAAEIEGTGYLIVTHEFFAEEMERFATLKETQGYTVTVQTVQDGVSIQEIKSDIKQLYEQPGQNLGYVLFVGDVSLIPTCTGVVSGKATDLCYANMNIDWYPEIGRGRFPVSTVDEAKWVVDKYIAYESIQGSEEWLRKAAFIATCDTNNFDVAERTHNFILNSFTLPRDYWGIFPNIPQPGGDKVYCHEYFSKLVYPREENIKIPVNDGRSLLVYSGHGDNFTWLDFDFDIEDVSNLTITGTLPLIASHACLTGNFAAEADRSLGEEWMLQENKGAIAFWGATYLTYWLEDEVLEKAAFTSYFTSPEGSVTLSEMTDYALMEVEAFSPTKAQYYWEIYNILGDPALVVKGSTVRPWIYLPLVSKE